MLKLTMMMAGLLAIGATAAAATPAVQVYGNESVFDAQRPGITTNAFSFPASSGGMGTTEASPYTYKGVTFSASSLTGFKDGRFGDASYLSNFANGSSDSYASTFTVSFAGPVLGLVLGSPFAAKTVNYTVNGQAGTVNVGAGNTTTFLGFDIGKPGSITVTFTGLGNCGLASELDILGFQTAVPEASTWAMLVIGVGAAGGALRRRRTATTRLATA